MFITQYSGEGQPGVLMDITNNILITSVWFHHPLLPTISTLTIKQQHLSSTSNFPVPDLVPIHLETGFWKRYIKTDSICRILGLKVLTEIKFDFISFWNNSRHSPFNVNNSILFWSNSKTFTIQRKRHLFCFAKTELKLCERHYCIYR